MDVASSLAATGIRLGSGRQVGELGERPEQPLKLYDFEGCPYCRKVREALSILDLEAIVYPCPKRGPRFREEVRIRGGKAQFPYLEDPNTGKALYESGEIVAYLFAQYGRGRTPWALQPGSFVDVSTLMASVPRPGFGSFYRPARAPEALLELYSFEASPFCRIVRETLTELELPYRLVNVAKGSRQRDAFVARSGRMQVPFLVDPNQKVELFESANIVAYLENTYAFRDGR
ncbi:MAG: glutathione S-transferase N-terminal domain-containing protein [Proteobacteria bacterium]|nr:glutathione S-transferase N-terminal domain-containing protein [Pseudomonadota bacterium]